jgi:conjugative relaxase-like TrwC/TraI family protein
MLSLARVSVEMGSEYYSHDDYYSTGSEDNKPEFFGVGARVLGLKDYNAISFDKLLSGVAPDGSPLRKKFKKSFPLNGKGSLSEISRNFKEELKKAGAGDKLVESNLKFLNASIDGTHLDKSFAGNIGKQMKSLSSATEPIHSKKINKIIDKYIGKVSQSNDRAGIDLTFSAPKGVSILALVKGDLRVVDAHREAVNFTLGYIEKNHIETRERKGKDRFVVKTGNMVAGLFQHGTSRLGDPQLHTHAVIMNTTQDKKGNWKSLHNDSLYKHSKLFGVIYQKKLNDLVRSIGYKTVPGKNGTFEIADYSSNQLISFSNRKIQMENLLKRFGREINQKSKRLAVLVNRPKKSKLAKEELKLGWDKRAKTIGLVHPIPTRVKHKSINWNVPVQNLEEKESVWSQEKLLRETLAHNMIRGSAEEILDGYRDSAQILKPTGKDREKVLVSAKFLEIEEKLVGQVKAGRAKLKPIAIDMDLDLFAKSSGYTLGQKDGLKLALTSKDKINAWQGVAGSGKSYALKHVKEIAESRGIKVVGLTPDGATAKSLRESTGVDTKTIDKFLAQSGRVTPKDQMFIVDEAGKIGSEKLLKMVNKIEKVNPNNRVLLVGDTRQVGAINAGSPFKLLQEQGMQTAQLFEHRRQRVPNLKRSVEFASDVKTISKSLDLLSGKDLIELRTKKGRIGQVIKTYLDIRQVGDEAPLIITDKNHDRNLITSKLRGHLKDQGMIEKTDHELTRLVNKQMSQGQQKSFWNYDAGDVIVPFKDLDDIGLKKGQQYEVKKVNLRKGMVLLSINGSDELISPKRFNAVSVYQKEKFQAAIGDKVQLTKNLDGFSNRDQLTIKEIGIDSIKFNETDKVLKLGKHGVHLDHALVMSTFSSQGKTARNVIYMADNFTTSKNWYVGISRAKDRAVIITDSRSKLEKNISKIVDKENAYDYKDQGMSL